MHELFHPTNDIDLIYISRKWERDFAGIGDCINA